MTKGRPCRAHSARTKLPCKAHAMNGAAVCGTHGGRAPQVKRKAAERIADMLADAIDPDRVLREAGRLAYSDIRQLYDEQGELLPIQQWPDDIARCVKSIESIRGNVDKGDGKFDEVVKVQLWDKTGRLQDLMKHHGQLTERLELGGALVVRWKGEERALDTATGGSQALLTEGQARK